MNNLSSKQKRIRKLSYEKQRLQDNYKVIVGKRQLDNKAALKAVAELDYLWFVFNDLNYVMDEEKTNSFIAKRIRKPLGLDTKDKFSEPIKITLEPKELNDLTLECYHLDNRKEITTIKNKHFLDQKKYIYQTESSGSERIIAKPLLIIASEGNDVKSKEAITCFLKSADKVTVSLTTGNLNHRDFLRQLYLTDTWHSRAEEIEYEQGKYFTHFQITFPIPDGDDEFNKLATLNEFMDLLLGVVLQSGRPVDYYSTTFYLPFYCPEKQLTPLLTAQSPYQLESVLYSEDKLQKMRGAFSEKLQETKDKEQNEQEQNKKTGDEVKAKKKRKEKQLKLATEAQAYYFFSPTVREQLFPKSKGKGLSIWRVKQNNLNGLGELSIESGPACNISQAEMVINKEIAIFSFTLTYDFYKETCKQFNKDNNWWLTLFEDKNKNESLIDFLLLTEHVRYLYPAFFKQKKEKKISEVSYKDDKCVKEQWAEKNTPVFNKAIKEMISRFFGEQVAEKVVNAVHSSSENKYTAYRDNRLFTSSCYVLRGGYHHDSPQAGSHEQLFQTALDVASVNKDGSFPHYSKAFTENYFEPYTYRRWQDLGTLMGSNEYGNTYIGYGEYMYHEIAKINIPYIYHRVTLLNLSYRSQLRYFEGAIASQGDRAEASNLRSQFIDFANNKWFKTVTDQPQGDELFTLQSKAFKLQEIYDQVNHEIAIADDYQRAENGKIFTTVGVFLTIIGSMLAFFDKAPVHQQIKSIIFSNSVMSGWLPPDFVKEGEFSILLPAIAFLIMIIVLFIALKLTKYWQLVASCVELVIVVCFAGWSFSILLVFPLTQFLLWIFNIILSPKGDR